MMMTVLLDVFGDNARKLADRLGLTMSGDITDMDTKITFTYRSIEGHPKIEVEFEI